MEMNTTDKRMGSNIMHVIKQYCAVSEAQKQFRRVIDGWDESVEMIHVV